MCHPIAAVSTPGRRGRTARRRGRPRPGTEPMGQWWEPPLPVPVPPEDGGDLKVGADEHQRGGRRRAAEPRTEGDPRDADEGHQHRPLGQGGQAGSDLLGPGRPARRRGQAAPRLPTPGPAQQSRPRRRPRPSPPRGAGRRPWRPEAMATIGTAPRCCPGGLGRQYGWQPRLCRRPLGRGRHRRGTCIPGGHHRGLRGAGVGAPAARPPGRQDGGQRTAPRIGRQLTARTRWGHTSKLTRRRGGRRSPAPRGRERGRVSRAHRAHRPRPHLPRQHQAVIGEVAHRPPWP